MGAISIQQLALALCRKSFAELVTYQINTNSYADLKTAIGGAKSCLPHEIQLEVDEIINYCVDVTSDERFWNNDSGMVLRFFTTMIERHLSDRFIEASERELIEIFHLVVMHCAYRARKKPRLLAFLNRTSRKSRLNNSLSDTQHSCPA